MRSAPLALALATLALVGCRTPSPAPSLLDKEFEAYRVDHEERRMEDMQARSAKAKTEADRLEGELAGLMRRIREAKAKLPEARAEAESLPATPPPPPPVPASVQAEAAGRLPLVVPAMTPGSLPPPEHRSPSAGPQSPPK